MHDRSATMRYWLPGDIPAAASSVARVRADFPALSRSARGRPPAWLDNAATTHKPRQVIESVDRFYREHNSNIHRGAHGAARRATAAYEDARARVAAFLGAAEPEEIVFTRGTTEAINLVAQSYGRAHVGPGDEVIASTLEHHSNIVPWQLLCAERGATLIEAPIDDSGRIDLSALAGLIGARTRIVAVTHVSNVLGTVAPIRAIAGLAHAAGAVLLVDGAQAVAHLPIDVRGLGADFYAFSGHKIFAPTGIGALYGRRDLLEAMPPWQGGGGMITHVTFECTRYAPVPARFEAGTPPIAEAIGLGAALEYLADLDLDAAWAHETALHTHARRMLAEIPGLAPVPHADPQISVLTFTLEGFEPETVARHLDQSGVLVRAGHHCAQPALRRFGLSSAVRPSLAIYNDHDDIDRLVAALTRLVRTPRADAPASLFSGRHSLKPL
jgi:cysteine desulfurase/selenocysteine lyase